MICRGQTHAGWVPWFWRRRCPDQAKWRDWAGVERSRVCACGCWWVVCGWVVGWDRRGREERQVIGQTGQFCADAAQAHIPMSSCARVPATAGHTASGQGTTQPAWCSHSRPAGSDTESRVQTGRAQYIGPEALWVKWLPTVSSPLPETESRPHPHSRSTSASPISTHRTCSRSQCLSAQAYPRTIRPSTSSRTASLRHAARHPAHVLNNASRSTHSSHPARAPAIFHVPKATANACRAIQSELTM